MEYAILLIPIAIIFAILFFLLWGLDSQMDDRMIKQAFFSDKMEREIIELRAAIREANARIDAMREHLRKL